MAAGTMVTFAHEESHPDWPNAEGWKVAYFDGVEALPSGLIRCSRFNDEAKRSDVWEYPQGVILRITRGSV